jgi:HprK-related kinase A
VKLGDLAPLDLAERMKRQGLDLDTGPFVVRIATPIANLANELRALYCDFTLEAEGGLADFHVAVRHPAGPLGVRRYWRQQAKVYVDETPPFEPLPIDMAVPMLEWSINWCAATQVNQYLMIHAAVLERHGHALVLPGVTGAGKSTLCAALAHRGWRLLSDEFALIQPADGQIAPWPRPISLKNLSVDVIRRWAPDAYMSPPVQNTTKGTVVHVRPPAESVRRARDRATPAWIVFPTYEQSTANRLTPLPKALAFFRLAGCSFNYETLGIQGFQTLSRMIERCDAFEFAYSSLEDALRLLVALPLPAPRP